MITNIEKIFSITDRINGFNRVYDREKKKLEVLKLRYEIEVIRKEHQLHDVKSEIDQFEAQLEQTVEESDKEYEPYFSRRRLLAIAGAYVGLYLSVISAVILTRFFPSLYQFTLEETPTSRAVFIEQVVLLLFSPIVFGGFSYAILRRKIEKEHRMFWASAFLIFSLLSATFFISLGTALLR